MQVNRCLERGLFTQFLKDLTQVALQGEMDQHLQDSLEQGNNRCYGINSKRVKTASGAFDLEVPRDRNSSFEPQLGSVNSSMKGKKRSGNISF